MKRREPQRSMYEAHGASLAQRVSLAIAVGAWVLLVWWLLADDGLQVAALWIGRIWQPGDVDRRIILATGFSIYYVRLLATEFVFLKRSISWSEVWAIAAWLLIIVLLLAINGGTNGSPIGLAASVGAALFVLGSWVNSYAEYARGVWKQKPEHHGQLYTGGLFRYSRHPNYFGDLLSFGTVPDFWGVGYGDHSYSHAGRICLRQCSCT